VGSKEIKKERKKEEKKMNVMKSGKERNGRENYLSLLI